MPVKNSKKRKYVKPAINVKKITINFFTNPKFTNQSLLANCSFCFGDTCPPDCSTTCFLGGTKVLTIKGSRNIEEINKDEDVVISYDVLRKKASKSEIKEVLIHKNVPLFLIINKHIKVTPEHKFWVNNKAWTKAKNIKIGDDLLNSKGERIAVTSKKSVNKIVTVYNLELKDDYHNYFAEDVLVHNWK